MGSSLAYLFYTILITNTNHVHHVHAMVMMNISINMNPLLSRRWAPAWPTETTRAPTAAPAPQSDLLSLKYLEILLLK